MRILVSIQHPAWAHQFHYVIRELEKRGHIVRVIAINKDRNLELLDAFNIKYDVISHTSGKNLIDKAIIFLKTTVKIFLISRKFKPDIYLGRASPMMAINSFLSRKRHIVFADTEHSRFNLFVARLFSDVIITPDCFRKDLGKKHLRINAYKEVFYLHPDYFTPDSSVLDEIGLGENERFTIVRFVSWQAHHDIGQHGFDLQGKRKLVSELKKYGRVFITSESPLSKEFENNRIMLPPERLHDLLYYAALYIGEGATVASECAVLGTPAILCSSFAGPGGSMGNFIELENKYDIVYSFRDPDRAILKAIELLQQPDLKEEWRVKKERLLEDKINATRFMLDFIENSPQSFYDYKKWGKY